MNHEEMKSPYDSEQQFPLPDLPEVPEAAVQYVFRQGLADEAEEIWQILQDGRAYLATQGVDQWQRIYPTLSDIQRDITLGLNWVLTARFYDQHAETVREVIVGTLVLLFDEEPTYTSLREGSWLQDGPYATLHRVVIRDQYRGKKLAKKLFFESYRVAIRQGVQYIRVDTHVDNQPMRSLIEQEGFTYCGKITVAGGDERLAYEKRI